LKENNIIRNLKGTVLSSEKKHEPYVYDGTTWKLARSLARTLCENLVASIQNQKEKEIKALIILDDNFLLQSMRKPYYNIGATYSTGFCEISF